jgi:hypothetical protein
MTQLEPAECVVTDLTALADTAALVGAEHGPSCPDAPFWAVQRFNLAEGDLVERVRLAEVYLTTKPCPACEEPFDTYVCVCPSWCGHGDCGTPPVGDWVPR